MLVELKTACLAQKTKKHKQKKKKKKKHNQESQDTICHVCDGKMVWRAFLWVIASFHWSVVAVSFQHHPASINACNWSLTISCQRNCSPLPIFYFCIVKVDKPLQAIKCEWGLWLKRFIGIFEFQIWTTKWRFWPRLMVQDGPGPLGPYGPEPFII